MPEAGFEFSAFIATELVEHIERGEFFESFFHEGDLLEVVRKPSKPR